MSAHTPGPWEIHPVNDCLIGADDTTVVYHFGENSADVALIAAAPDLFAALKAVMEGIDDYWATLEPGHVQAARAAIAKAEQQP